MNTRPLSVIGSAYSYTPRSGVGPLFRAEPRDFSTMLASPPAWLPWVTWPLNWTFWPAVKRCHQARRSSSFWPTAGLMARRVSMNSTPWISGVSDRMAVPPWRTRMSIAAPSAGLALMPEKPSEPPHSSPMQRWLALTLLRRAALASGSISSTARMPASMVARGPAVSCITSVRGGRAGGGAADFLHDQRAQGLAGAQALRLDQRIDLVALAAQANDEHARQVGVARVARERAAQQIEMRAGR